MDTTKLKQYGVYILSMMTLVILFLFFSWWGLVGYIIFVLLMAGYIIKKRWTAYIAICDYGANQLNKVMNNRRSKDKKKDK